MANEGVTRILNQEAEQADRAAELEKLRRNITILFTDLKGSTAYFEKFGDAAGLLMVHRCNTMLSEAVERHGGHVIKTIGDAVMASFEDHAEAVAASIEMQEAITADNAAKPEDQRVSVRIGINYGLGFVKSNDVFGDVVNVASRVESAAAPEQILISESLYRAVADSGRFRLRHAGKFALKGKAEHQDLYEVGWRGTFDQPPSASHSMFMPVLDLDSLGGYKLVQVRNDGKTPREFELCSAQVLIGRTQGDFTFPHDEQMLSPHVRLTVEAGQMFMEPVAKAAAYFSLIGPYRLQHGDVVRFGSQLLEFRVDAAALEAASTIGTAIGDLLLHGAVAEFASLRSDRKRYPLREYQTTFGRSKGTYTFPTDPAMSRAHVRVYHRGEDFFLEDSGSTNGTFVMATEKTPIPERAILAISGQLLRVCRGDSGKTARVSD
ncbi:MAG TPA: adenylate/guanylate cyclase domain-containing protein [Terriglobales bacterium]|nr:adenylate/guanylate cyclase domain-containing protein [Terriglobales bacterium]